MATETLYRLSPVSFRQVRVEGGFWGDRVRVNREVTIPIEYEQCRKTGRLAAWKLDWRPGDPDPPHIFWDSDVAKWIEAAAYSLATHPDPGLVRRVDRVVDWIAAAQQPDGYLNVHFTVVEPEKRWTNLRVCHELYCAGHLMEAAVAYHQATGKRKLLDTLSRYADYIGRVFGSKKGQKRGYPGHEEIELALVKLYRETGEDRYLDLARFFVEERGRRPHYFDAEARARGEDPGPWKPGKYDALQAHLPAREQATAEGHAVRACYLYTGMADVAAETGDRDLLKACRRLWKNIVERRMYIHGGVGSTRFGERFTFDYDLPNEAAYAETCAAIALVFFAHRMLQVEADGQYADAMERALYNGVISGVSLDGTRFFYDNLLAVHPEAHRFTGQKPPTRQGWFGCACCPPNLARVLASLGQYVYSPGGRDLYVHLYVNGCVRTEVGGVAVEVAQRTEYPWAERVRISVRPEREAAFTLALRIPGWCGSPSLSVNGEAVDVGANLRKGYVRLRRRWMAGDTVDLRLPMPPVRVEAHPSVRQACGQVALQRGPLVYCLEEADNGKDLNDLVLPRQAKLSVKRDPGLFGGVPVLVARGKRRTRRGWNGVLYRPVGSSTQTVPLKAVPYFMWANRGAGEMLVWVREG